MTLIAMVSLFAVVVVILVHAETAGILGICLLCAGSYVRSPRPPVSVTCESRLGFEILRTRGGGFVFGSALVFCVVGRSWRFSSLSNEFHCAALGFGISGIGASRGCGHAIDREGVVGHHHGSRPAAR